MLRSTFYQSNCDYRKKSPDHKIGIGLEKDKQIYSQK